LGQLSAAHPGGSGDCAGQSSQHGLHGSVRNSAGKYRMQTASSGQDVASQPMIVQ
jgi:hypothetical protein